jgi:hypothetical protein
MFSDEFASEYCSCGGRAVGIDGERRVTGDFLKAFEMGVRRGDGVPLDLGVFCSESEDESVVREHRSLVSVLVSFVSDPDDILFNSDMRE